MFPSIGSKPGRKATGASGLFQIKVTVDSNVLINTSALFIGNSTVNSLTNSSVLQITNSTSTGLITALDFSFGNSTANTTGNSTAGVIQTSTTVNSNYSATLVQVANSTSIANVTAAGFAVGTSIVNTTVLAAGANVIIGTVSLQIGNSTVNAFANSLLINLSNSTSQANLSQAGLVTGTSTVNTTAISEGANVIISTTGIFVGNSVANLTSNSILMSVSNSTTSSNQTPGGFAVGALGTLAIGNSTVNTFANSSFLRTTGNSFTLGTSSATGNGFTWLPNAVLFQWGWVSANSTAGNATFPTAFPTACFSFSMTSNMATGETTKIPFLSAGALPNTTVIQIRTANATNSNVHYFAIGN